MDRQTTVFTLTLMALLSGCTLGYDLSVYDGVGRHWEYVDDDFQDQSRERNAFRDNPPERPSQRTQLSFADGAQYEGDVVAGVPHGYGVFQFADGARYEGSFWQGVFHGSGRIDYSDGRYYEGQMANSRAEGDGTAASPSGDKRVGRFRDGQFVRGSRHTADGTQYDGEFRQGRLYGVGLVTAPNGTSHLGYYHGETRNGLYIANPDSSDEAYEVWRDGDRVLSTLGPTRLAGPVDNECRVKESGFHWVAGHCGNGSLANGRGTAISEDRSIVLDGHFRDGRLVEGARLVLPSQATPITASSQRAILRRVDRQSSRAIGEQAGLSITVSASDHDRLGDLVIGSWHNGTPEGEARLFSATRLIYDGDLSNGKPHGQGVCLIEGLPQRCEHHQGERSDTAWLLTQLNADLSEVHERHERRVESIEQAIRSDRTSHRRQYEAGLDSIDREIRRQQNLQAFSSSIEATAASMQGDMQARQRHLEAAQREVARLEDEKARRQERYAREQQDREERWAESRRQQLREANQTLDQEVSDIVTHHRELCERLPNRYFNSDRECVAWSE